MYCFRSNHGWMAHTPGKLNLFFEVHGKRSDGFHEITSLALPIRLFDTVFLEPTESETIELECFGGGEDIPLDGRNIVVRALELLRQKYRIAPGARIRLLKRIPSQAGLGGGSSDAAAILACADRLWNLGLSVEELTELGAELGSDCPIFFQPGASLSRGRGEYIEPFTGLPKLDFVLLKPPEGLSTAMVFSQCMPLHDGKIRSLDMVKQAIRTGSLPELGRSFFNRLEIAAESVWPGFGEVKKRFDRLGCLAVQMSGSGTVFFGLCRNSRHAREVAGTLRQQCFGEIFVV